MTSTRRAIGFRHSIWAAALLTIGGLLSHPDNALAQWSSSGNSVYLNNNGNNVGVGTSTPASKLEVFGNIALSPSSYITSAYDWGNYMMPYENATGRMALRTAGVDRLSILYSGKVGIGTTAPNYDLHVVKNVNGVAEIRVTQTVDGSNNFASFSLEGPGSGGQNTMAFGATGPGYTGIAGFNNTAFGLAGDNISNGLAFMTSNASAPIKFITGGANPANEKMRINSAGNVGIGTTSPTSKLHVIGDVLVKAGGGASGNITADGNIAAKYQDVAEWVPASRAIPAGTVVVVDVEQSNHVLPSTRTYDTRVAGVVSAKPE